MARLQIDAPPALRAVLEQHLDLAQPVAWQPGEGLSDDEWNRLIQALPAQAKRLLQTEGYFQAEVTVERLDAPPAEAQAETTAAASASEPAADGAGAEPPARLVQQPQLRVRVQPGPQASIGSVTLRTEGPALQAADAGDLRAQRLLADLRSRWPLQEGALFQGPAWSEAKDQFLMRLRAEGYATATWSGTAAEVDPATNRVRLYLVADSGPLFKVGPVRIEGAGLHSEAEARALLGIPEGVPVTEALLLDAQDRLQRSGLYDRATVLLAPDATPEAATLVVTLSERAAHELTVGLGVDSVTGPRVSVEHTWRRVAGRPLTLRHQGALGRSEQSWQGDLSTHADALGQRWTAGFALAREATESEVTRWYLLRAGRVRNTPRLDRYVFLQWDRSSREPRVGTREEADAYTANWHWTHKRVDSLLLPTTGRTLALQVAAGRVQAAGGTGQSGPLARVWGRLNLYRPLPGGWYGHARVELGQVFAPAAAVLTDSLLFRAGGDDSVRGYAYRTLGPQRGGALASGRVIATGSLEAARPILASLPSIWGAVFVDAGNAADHWGDLKPVYGLGVGVRWRSPVGPMRLDLAYGEALRKLRMHFSVGVSF